MAAMAIFATNGAGCTGCGVSNGFNRISGGTGTTDGLYITSATGRDIAFRTNGSATTSMLITSGGNVGIGTTNMGGKFQVKIDTDLNIAFNSTGCYN